MSKKTMATMLALTGCVAMTLTALAGCGAATGSCTASWTRSDGSSGKLCSEQTAEGNVTANDFKAICETGGGTYSSAVCPSENQLGICGGMAPLNGTDGAVLAVEETYYSTDGVTEAEAKEKCMANGGSFTPG